MITVTGRGWYHFLKKPSLLTTKQKDSLLILDKEHESGVIKTAYRFNPDREKAKISFVSTGRKGIDGKIISGRFRMYGVSNEKLFKNGTHLELCEEAGKWNCYVLPNGLPDEKELQKDYFRTNTCITKCSCGKN